MIVYPGLFHGQSSLPRIFPIILLQSISLFLYATLHATEQSGIALYIIYRWSHNTLIMQTLALCACCISVASPSTDLYIAYAIDESWAK